MLLCNVANSPFAWFPRLFGTPVVLNVDGLDRQRGKWNALGRAVLHVCEWMSTFTPTRVVTDAESIHDYYRDRYGKESTVIGYGSDMPAGEHSLDGFNLQPGRYVLYVSRLEPENNPDLVLEAWRKVRTDWPLVMVGDNRYDSGYLERLKQLADDRVMFPGAIYGDGYWALQKHAGVFVFACEVGGVHPALIEAMAAENPVLYLESPENNVTAGDAAIRFSKSADDLAAKLQVLLDDPAAREEWAGRAGARARQLYRWDEVAEQYEKLFAGSAGPWMKLGAVCRCSVRPDQSPTWPPAHSYEQAPRREIARPTAEQRRHHAQYHSLEYRDPQNQQPARGKNACGRSAPCSGTRTSVCRRNPVVARCGPRCDESARSGNKRSSRLNEQSLAKIHVLKPHRIKGRVHALHQIPCLARDGHARSGRLLDLLLIE